VAETVCAIAQRALRLVAARRPDVYRQMAIALDGLRMDIRADGHLILESAGGRLVEVEVDAGRRAELRLRTDRRTVRALIAARTTLIGAVRAGDVEIAGTTDVLARGLEAFEYFVGALLRIEDAAELRRSLEGCDEPG
jgi:hypothetical protein